MNPLFSIIIPAYNAGEFLGKAVDSVLEQDFNDYELIIVDDGSTDNTPQICKEYAEKNSDKIIVISKDNQGVSAARNAGIKIARGQYILFIDSDDFIEPDSLSVLSKSITQLGCPDILVFGILSNKFPWVPSDNPVNTVLDREYIETVIIPEQINLRPRTRDIQPFIWNKAFKKSIIDNNEIAFDESHRKWNDKEFVIWFLKYAQTMVCIDAALYNYESVNTSETRISNNFNPDLILSISKRDRTLLERFDNEYHISESQYYKNYMFHIILNLCEDVIIHNYKEKKKLFEIVFSDASVRDWAKAAIPESRSEKAIAQAVNSGNLTNIDTLIELWIIDRKKKAKQTAIREGIVSYPKKALSKMKRFLKKS